MKLLKLSKVTVSYTHLDVYKRQDVGTSYAAPKVAYAAAQVYNVFPEASANLVRALLVSSAQIPQESYDLFSSKGMDDEIIHLCGYGRPFIDHAINSDNARVVLYNEAGLAFDNFHIYEVPITCLLYTSRCV